MKSKLPPQSNGSASNSVPERQPSFCTSNRSNIYSKNDDVFRDSLENSSLNLSKENNRIPDSLNNTAVFRTSFTDHNQKSNRNKHQHTKGEFSAEDSPKQEQDSEEETKKISYKYMSNYPLINNTQIQKGTKVKDIKYFWFAAYDKLLHRKHIDKIISYYPSPPNAKAYTIKEKPIILKDYEISYNASSTKPYVTYVQGGYIFVKLYYLSLYDINKIFNYINKIEYTLSEDLFIFNNTIGNNIHISHNNINYPYPHLCCLGSFLNVNIYTFSNIQDTKRIDVQLNNSNGTINNNNKDVIKLLPKTSKITKIVKYLVMNFPTYSIEFFIYYLISTLHTNTNTVAFNEKVADIKAYYISKRKALKLNINSVNNTDSSIQSINVNNINLNVNVTKQIKSSKNKNSSLVCYNHNNNSNGNNINSVIHNVPKTNSNNTQYSSIIHSNHAELTMMSYNPKPCVKGVIGIKHSAIKSLNYSKQSSKNFISAKGNVNKTYGPSNNSINNSNSNNNYNTINNTNQLYSKGISNTSTSDKRKGNNIYVVNRKLKSDVDFDCDDDSSINTKRDKSNEKKVYVTPKKKKVSKYYS